MEFTTEENKAKVVINTASFGDAIKLKSALEKSLMDRGINLEGAIDADLPSLFLAADSSQEVFSCLFKCLEKSTYNGVKITMDTFEDEAARLDFYEVVFYCLKVNIFPFFKYLCSRLGISFAPTKNTDTQK